ncbi:MAG: FimB/Mfa2 family fimbrial subunit [Paramuribaculum sp.]|nr:FimB/Mfa2 family fimbrial subunit [Paramuribaculum sp.]
MSICIKIRQLFAVLATLLLVTSCDSFLFDEEEDCTVYYRLKFRYDMNLKFADAFAHEVTSVRLFAFNDKEELVWQGTEHGEVLRSENYSMTLPLPPGSYRLVAWCGLGNEETFSLPDAASAAKPADLHCRMNLDKGNPPSPQGGESQSGAPGNGLYPLFHGMINVELPADDDGGEYFYEMPLTKDTNVFRVMLQHLSAEDLRPEDFTFSIEDVNGWLAYDNSLLHEQPVQYRPWALYSGEAGVGSENRDITQVKVVMAEMTVSRLFIKDWSKYKKPVLTIRAAKDGKLIASLPIIDYALMVKGAHLSKMDDQEYLDRADEYNMTLFLDDGFRWIGTQIQVLSWVVVENRTDL